MRKLVVLRGASGSGKSTFIEKNNLERFTLSSDKIRLMFNSPVMDIEGKEVIPQFNNEKVWDLLFYLLEERMKKGEFTIIDAVHANREDLNAYKTLAEKYRYRLYLVDFTDIPKEEVYARNKMREAYKIVPEHIIDKAYRKFEKESVPKSFKIVKLEEYSSIVSFSPRSLDNYKSVHVIGDIHGCYSCLKDYFENNPINDEDFYIFLGDYFDRGIENYETFLYLSELQEKDNVMLLIGNHEDKLYKYACDDEFVMDYGIKLTIQEFESKGIDKKRIRGFIKGLSQIAFISFKDKKYLITHGGIPYFPSLPLDYFSTNSFIYGALKYDENIDEIYNNYMKNCDDKVYQIHGHRNYYKVNPGDYEYSFNLEGDIENGGYLRIMNIKEDGTFDFDTFKNNVYNENYKEESGIYDLINDLRKDKNVYEKELGNNISSFNFTREAFYKSIWNKMTTKARGIFLDTSNYHIVARSYDKFFNVDEREETSILKLKDLFIYPVSAYLKYNGFLGIVSCYQDELFFASKTTNTGDYVEYFKTIFYNTFNKDKIDIIKNKLKVEKASMIFEVIDPINDPHIIKYDESQIVLLDLVKNDLDFTKMPYQELLDFGDSIGVQTKKLLKVIKSKEELEKYFEELHSDDYKYDNLYIEGAVFEDEVGFMTKYKTKYYETWKHLRNVMENVVLNNNYELKYKKDLDNSFVQYLKKKYENKEVTRADLNIINERDEFIGNIK